MGHVLAIDLGTTGLKVAVVDADGLVVASAGERHTLQLLPGNGAEQDPEAWWQALGRCSRRVVARPSEISAIAVTSQYMSVVAVDRHGSPLSACQMWMDQRGAPHHPMLGRRDHLALFLERQGMPPIPNDNVAHIHRLLAEQPSLATAQFLEPGDALTARLTGRVTATQTTAIGMLATDNRCWGTTSYDPELLALTGIAAEQLATLVPVGSVVGTVTSGAAAHLGVSPETVVVTASIDTITSAVGTGAIDASSCGLMIGTTGVLVSHLGDKRADFASGIPTMPSALVDRWFVMAENGLAGKALEHATELTGYATIDAALGAAVDSPPGASGVTYAPWLVGSMAPGNDDDVRGAWVGLGLATSRANMIRAVLEGVALNATWLIEPVQALTGHRYRSVVAGGGGARSALWLQVFADCLGVPVHGLAEPATVNARGAAALVRHQLGELSLGDLSNLLRVEAEYEPQAGGVAAFAGRREQFIELHQHLGAWQRRS